jgi:hypothetical protein
MVPPAAPSGLTAAERAVVALAVTVAVLLAIQPVFAPRLPERQSEFTWEMFAKAGPRDEFLVEGDGFRQLVSIADMVRPARANTDYTEVLPAHLCRTVDGAVRVTVLRADEILRQHECQP